MIIDGKKLADELLQQLKEKRKTFGRLRLVGFLFGPDPEKEKFLEIKKRYCELIDIDFRVYEIEEAWSRQKARSFISDIVKSDLVNGVLIELPIPKRFPTQYFLNSIPPNKDTDCLSSRALGQFFTDRFSVPPRLAGQSETLSVLPPAVAVVDFLIKHFKIDLSGKLVAVAGYGKLVGQPVAHYTLRAGATVVVINSKTQTPERFFKEADVILSGVGKPNLIQECKEGAVLIDFGYSSENNKVSGDVDFDKLEKKAALITPTPGGTGPLLVVKVIENLLILASQQK